MRMIIISMVATVLFCEGTFSQTSPRVPVQRNSMDFQIREFLADLRQAIVTQDVRRVEAIDEVGSRIKTNSLSQRFARLATKLSTRSNIQSLKYRPMHDFYFDILNNEVKGDTNEVVVNTGFFLSEMKGNITLKFVEDGDIWTCVSLQPLWTALDNYVQVSHDERSLPQIMPSAVSGVQSTIINYRFTDKTLSWNPMPFQADPNGDGKLTEADAQMEFGRPIVFTPIDVADIVYSSGEEVYFCLDMSIGFIAYLSSSDWDIRYFDPVSTSLGPFDNPKAITADPYGNVYVLDSGNNRIVKLHYNSSSKAFDTWTVVTNQLNNPSDFDLNYGNNTSDPSDDYLVIANTGNGKIIAIQASNGQVIQEVSSYTSSNGAETIGVPLSVAIKRWTTSNSNRKTYVIAKRIDGNYYLHAVNPFNPSAVVAPPMQFPAGSTPSKIRIDSFDAWVQPNLWVFDYTANQLHKFQDYFYSGIYYICSYGSTGFQANQFNGPQSIFITHNYNSSSIYLDLMTVELYTSTSGGKWYYPGSDILNISTEVSPNRDYVTFNFLPIGNSSTLSALIKNTSGQTVGNLSSGLTGRPYPQTITWFTNGNRGNFTLELYFQHVGGVSSISKTIPFSVIDPLSVTMSGPTTVYHADPKGQPPNCNTWTTNVSGGVSPYSYVWSWPASGTNSSYSECFSWNGYGGGSYQRTYRVDVTDSQNSTAYATKVVTAYNSGGGIDPRIVEETSEVIPEQFGLGQNYPNPFNPETEITFALPEPSIVRFTVLDILGREVAVLREGHTLAGYRSVRWNGRNSRNEPVSSGMYFYRITAIGESGKNFVETKRMIITK